MGRPVWYNDFHLPEACKELTDSQKRGIAAMKIASYQFAGGVFYTMFFTPNSPLFHTGKLLVPMQ